MDLCLFRIAHSTYNDYETVFTYDHTSKLLILSMYLEALFLILFGISAYIHRPIGNSSPIRNCFIFYCFNTALFIVIRAIFDRARFLLIGVLMHNMVEWGILAVLIFANPLNKNYTIFVVIWFIFLFSCSYFIPDFDIASLIGQVTGMICDFFLLFTFIARYKDGKKGQKKVFLSGIISASLHFGTIMPLVLTGLSVSPFMNLSLTWISQACVPLTFISYHRLVLKWEKFQKSAETKKAIPKLNEDMKKSKVFTIVFIAGIVAIGFFAGIISLPECKTVGYHSLPEYRNFEAFTAVKTDVENHDAMLEELLSIVNSVEKQKGLISYKVLSSLTQKGVFTIEEEWENLAFFETYRASALFRNFFNSPYYNSLKTEEARFGPVNTVYPLYSKTLNFSFNIELHCPAAEVWGKLGTFADSTYFPSAKTTEMVSLTEKTITLDNQTVLKIKKIHSDSKKMTLKQEIHGSFNSKVTDEFQVLPGKFLNSSLIKVKVQFESENYLTSLRNTIKEKYINDFIPALQKGFACYSQE